MRWPRRWRASWTLGFILALGCVEGSEPTRLEQAVASHCERVVSRLRTAQRAAGSGLAVTDPALDIPDTGRTLLEEIRFCAEARDIPDGLMDGIIATAATAANALNDHRRGQREVESLIGPLGEVIRLLEFLGRYPVRR